MAYSNKS